MKAVDLVQHTTEPNRLSREQSGKMVQVADFDGSACPSAAECGAAATKWQQALMPPWPCCTDTGLDNFALLCPRNGAALVGEQASGACHRILEDGQPDQGLSTLGIYFGKVANVGRW